MTFRKAVTSFSLGLLFAVLAIGLLPFLVVFSYSELTIFSESHHLSPLLLLQKLYKDDTDSNGDNLG